jgi:hypothetical protein
MNVLRDSLIVVAKSNRVWLLQFLFNPILMALAALWLLIPEARAWQVILTMVAVLLLVIFFLWLHASTFAYFANVHTQESARFRSNFLPANLIAFALWALVFVFLIHFTQHMSGEFQPQLASYFRSISPSWLRQAITQSRMDSLVALKFWVLIWIIIPALCLPIGLQTSTRGFHALNQDGCRGWRHTVGSRAYWSLLIVLAIIGVYVPNVLIAWLPKVSSVTAESISLTIRLLLAWFLAVSSWTLLISVLGRLGRSASPGELGGQAAS